LCKHAAISQESLGVKAIVTDNRTGHTSRTMASYRAKVPVYALCYNMKVTRRLALSYGVVPVYEESESSNVREFLFRGLNILTEQKKLERNDLIAYVGGSSETGASFLEINPIEKILSTKDGYIKPEVC
jgi:pyruvate kinase